MPYNPTSDYLKFQSSNSSSSEECCGTSDPCSCCPIGTVAVYNEDGSHAGCLTPNDAALYKVDKHIPEEGYMKVFDPNTGAYLGDLPHSSAIETLDYLSNGNTSSQSENVFNIVSPLAGSSGFVELAELLASGNSSPVSIDIDRVGLTDALSLSIINSNEGIEFYPVTSVSIPGVNSNVSVQFNWSGIIGVAGTYTFVIQLQSPYETKEIPFRLTLS